MTEPEVQAPVCLSYPMRRPQAQGMFEGSEPVADWLLMPPGTPFEVRAWENGRWTIRVGREQVAQGRAEATDKEPRAAQVAASEAGAKLTGWAMTLIPAVVTEPIKQAPQEFRKK